MMFKRLFLTFVLFLSSSRIFAQDTQITELRYLAMDKEIEKVMAQRGTAMDEAMYKISRRKKERFFFIPKQRQALLRLNLNPTILL